MSDDPDFEQIARQLRCPEGDAGRQTGADMHAHNLGMTRAVMASLTWPPGARVLEIGPGSARHLHELLDKAPQLWYRGIDISAVMIDEARTFHSEACQTGQADFILTDGQTIPFADATFHRVFSVNTLYFWTDPAAYLREIGRVLRPDGHLCLAGGTKSFMEKLPFVRYGFRLYDEADGVQLLTSQGFLVTASSTHTEVIRTVSGEDLPRTFWVMTAIQTR